MSRAMGRVQMIIRGGHELRALPGDCRVGAPEDRGCEISFQHISAHSGVEVGTCGFVGGHLKCGMRVTADKIASLFAFPPDACSCLLLCEMMAIDTNLFPTTGCRRQIFPLPSLVRVSGLYSLYPVHQVVPIRVVCDNDRNQWPDPGPGPGFPGLLVRADTGPRTLWSTDKVRGPKI
jgi:hypothetical protein